jgi:carbonic anhydrase
MSCSNATAPIDINRNTKSICNLKCSYTFNYAPTTLQIQNMGSYLLMKVDDTNMPPVIYNDQNYNVSQIRLYHPSIHRFSGNRADAELIITHNSVRKNRSLIVCIPIMQSSTATTDSVNFFDLIIAEVAKTANSGQGNAIFSKPTFTLAKFIPMRPYYSYNGTLPYSPCTGDNDYVVFHKDDATLMSSEAFRALNSITRNYYSSTSVTNQNGLYYNANGPVPRNKGEIYIDCQPTGDDGEVFMPLKPDSGGLLKNKTMGKFFSFTLVKLGIGAIVMFIIWKVSNTLITKIATRTVQYAKDASDANSQKAADKTGSKMEEDVAAALAKKDKEKDKDKKGEE